HFACTGGTLISKCLAAMPNVQLLSEIDPLSSMHAPGVATFAPTDLILRLNQSTRGIGQDTLVEIFQAWLRIVVADCDRRGLRLILRDHSHSHFCIGDKIPDRPTLRELALDVGPVLSAVTVRHPM